MTKAKKNDGGRAFPLDATKPERDGSYYPAHPGMSLRDWFAGHALAACRLTLQEGDVQWIEQHGAENVYRIADAMLAAREATK